MPIDEDKLVMDIVEFCGASCGSFSDNLDRLRARAIVKHHCNNAFGSTLVVMVSTDHVRGRSPLEDMHMTGYDDSTSWIPNPIVELKEFSRALEMLKREFEEDECPAGMSPSFHHIQNKERKSNRRN